MAPMLLERGLLPQVALLVLLSSSLVQSDLRRVRTSYIDDEDFARYRRGDGDETGSGEKSTQPPAATTTKTITTTTTTPAPTTPECTDEVAGKLCGDVCKDVTCRDYPEASCKANNCQDCKPTWWVDNKMVNCTDRPVYCPGLWLRRGTQCYRVQNRYGFDWAGAQNYCVKQGGYLVAIGSSTEQSGINSLPLRHDCSYWTGGRKVGSVFKWKTPEGIQSMSYSNWAYREPNHAGKPGFPEDAVDMELTRGRYWQWNDLNNLKKLNPICEASRDKILTHCDSKPCLNGGNCVNVGQDMYKCECDKKFAGKYCELYNDINAWESHENHVYLIVTDYSIRRDDAISYCSMYDAFLLSINNEGESDFISNKLAAKGVDNLTYRFWLGGYKAGYKLWWADGSEVTYKNWHRGEPNSSAEKFIMLQYYSDIKKWQWNDVAGNGLANFICEKPNYPKTQARGLNNSLKHGTLKRWSDPDPIEEYLCHRKSLLHLKSALVEKPMLKGEIAPLTVLA